MWLTKHRPDWLAELQGALTAVLVVAPVAMIWNAAVQVGNGRVGPEVPASWVDGVAGATGGLPPGAEVAGGSTVEVAVADPTAGQVTAWLFTWLPSAALFLTVAVLLRRLVRDARRHDPFTMVTVRRLRVLAVVTLAGGVVVNLLESLAETQVARLALDNIAATYDLIPGTALLVGIAFLAIAEVVRRGCAMREELETVI